MATNRAGQLLPGNFAGSRRLFARGPLGLFGLVVDMLREAARTAARRLALSAMTDSSGGTSGGTVGTVTVPPVADTSASGGLTPASFNTIADTIANAYATLVERANLVRAVLGMGSAPTGPGTPGGGTVGAIAVAVSAASGDSSASQSTVALVFASLLNAQATARRNVDEILAAVGMTLTTAASEQGTIDGDLLTLPALADAAVVSAGTSATTGVAKTAVDAQLVILRNNVAYLTAKLSPATVAPTGALASYAGIGS